MPLYEYQCAKCGAVFEVRQKFSDDPVTVHEGCGGSVVKQMSAPAFQFKGTGWYVTDYAKSGSSPAPSSSESKSEPKSETKSDSKPAESKPSTETKSESKPAGTSTKSD